MTDEYATIHAAKDAPAEVLSALANVARAAAETQDAKAGTVTVRVLTLDTEEALHDHAERLNERGEHPDVAIMDAKGIAVLASRTAPGGDGWGFAYYAPCEDGFMHCPNPDCCGDCADRTWKPTFPVTALAVSSRFPT